MKRHAVRLAALGTILVHAIMEWVGFCPVHF